MSNIVQVYGLMYDKGTGGRSSCAFLFEAIIRRDFQ